MSTRQIVLDTETTGLEVLQGHRIIEIGCVELVNRRPTGNNFHRYVNPGRSVDSGAVGVHGITDEFLADKPSFREIAADLWKYFGGDELIIHNAPFDVGFLDTEFERAARDSGDAPGQGRYAPLGKACPVTDTVALARRMHPGQKASLDALCKRYNVDNSHREFHGALLDARLLADVYLAMTGGQSALLLDADGGRTSGAGAFSWADALGVVPSTALIVIRADAEEAAAHAGRLKEIDKKSGGLLVWKSDLQGPPAAAPQLTAAPAPSPLRSTADAVPAS